MKSIYTYRSIVWTLVVLGAIGFVGGQAWAQDAQPQDEAASPAMTELSEQIEALSQEIERLQQEVEEADPYRELGAVPGYNPRARYYEVPPGFPKFDSRVRYLGNLRGTWHEMGVQYGERAGDLILTVYNYSAQYYDEKLGMEHIQADLPRYVEQLEAYSPQMIEFMEGIAEGAAKQLKKSPYADALDDFQKIVLVNAFYDLDFFHPMPDKHEGAAALLPEQAPGAAKMEAQLMEHCTGLALSGKPRGDLPSPTRNGETIITNHYDTVKFVPYSWNTVYVATPSDPDAHVYWSIQPAGMVGAANLIVNDKGVTFGGFFGGQSEDDAYEFGVLTYPLQTHAVAYADTAQDAVETVVFGNAEYRDHTGRQKVLQTGLHSYLVADANEVMVLETTPHRHAVRYPGDLGEAGNYVIYANWYGSQHYYDENNELVNEPIGSEEPEFPERYWTYDWFIKYHLGHLDEELVREGQRSRYYFDQETGRRIDFLEGSPIPLYIGVHTISAYWGAALGLEVGGTAHAAQVVQEPRGRIKANWVQGRPAEWVGPWQSTDLYGYQK